jgi:hypothetical protein
VLPNMSLSENPAVDIEKMAGKLRRIFSLKPPKIPGVQPAPACDHLP